VPPHGTPPQSGPRAHRRALTTSTLLRHFDLIQSDDDCRTVVDRAYVESFLHEFDSSALDVAVHDKPVCLKARWVGELRCNRESCHVCAGACESAQKRLHACDVTDCINMH
jgi:hypothetical protein